MDTENARAGLINWALTEFTRAQVRADRLSMLIQAFRDLPPERITAMVADGTGAVTPAAIRTGLSTYLATTLDGINSAAAANAAHYTALIGQNTQARKAMNKLQPVDLEPYLEAGQTADGVKADLLAQYDQRETALKDAKSADARRAKTERIYMAQLTDTIATATDDEIIKLFKLA